MAKVESELKTNMLITLGKLAVCGFVCWKQYRSNFTWINVEQIRDLTFRLKALLPK